MYSIQPPMKATSMAGFTLLELIVTLVIVASIAAIGMPAYSNIIQRNEVSQVARRFESALQLANRTAYVSGRSIRICPSDDVTIDSPTCATNWNKFAPNQGTATIGWIVFRDNNGDGDLDADETIYKRDMFDNPSIAMAWTRGSRTITLSPRNTTGTNGTMRFYAHGAGSLTAWDADSPPAIDSDISEKRVVLSGLGRVTFQQ